MLTWIVLWVQLRSVTLLMELGIFGRDYVASWPMALRAAPRAPLGALPRLTAVRSQFSSRGFGGQFGSARALCSLAGQRFAIQDRLGQGSVGKLCVLCRRISRFALPGGSFVFSGAASRT